MDIIVITVLIVLSVCCAIVGHILKNDSIKNIGWISAGLIVFFGYLVWGVAISSESLYYMKSVPKKDLVIVHTPTATVIEWNGIRTVSEDIKTRAIIEDTTFVCSLKIYHNAFGGISDKDLIISIPKSEKEIKDILKK